MIASPPKHALCVFPLAERPQEPATRPCRFISAGAWAERWLGRLQSAEECESPRFASGCGPTALVVGLDDDLEKALPKLFETTSPENFAILAFGEKKRDFSSRAAAVFRFASRYPHGDLTVEQCGELAAELLKHGAAEMLLDFAHRCSLGEEVLVGGTAAIIPEFSFGAALGKFLQSRLADAILSEADLPATPVTVRPLKTPPFGTALKAAFRQHAEELVRRYQADAISDPVSNFEPAAEIDEVASQALEQWLDDVTRRIGETLAEQLKAPCTWRQVPETLQRMVNSAEQSRAALDSKAQAARSALAKALRLFSRHHAVRLRARCAMLPLRLLLAALRRRRASRSLRNCLDIDESRRIAELEALARRRLEERLTQLQQRWTSRLEAATAQKTALESLISDNPNILSLVNPETLESVLEVQFERLLLQSGLTWREVWKQTFNAWWTFADAAMFPMPQSFRRSSQPLSLLRTVLPDFGAPIVQGSLERRSRPSFGSVVAHAQWQAHCVVMCFTFSIQRDFGKEHHE